MIAEAKKELKKSDTAKTIAEKYGLDDDFEDIIDGMPVMFNPETKASGETNNGVVSLNLKLMDKPDKILEYLVHEFTHVCQHILNEGKSEKIKKEKRKDYLNRESEQEAFHYQVQYQIEEQGLSEAKDYVEKLLDYHKIPKKSKKRNTLRKMLLEGKFNGS